MYRNVSNCSQEKKCIKINKVFSRCNVKITKEDFFKCLQNGFFWNLLAKQKGYKIILYNFDSETFWLKDYWNMHLHCANSYWTSYLYLWNKRDQTIAFELEKIYIFLVKIPKHVALPLKIYIEKLLL